MSNSSCDRTRVLLVDALSSSNYYSVELAQALAEHAEVTSFTVRDTLLTPSEHLSIIRAFPVIGSGAGKARKALQEIGALGRLIVELWRHRRHTVHVQFLRIATLEIPVFILMSFWLNRLIVTAHNALPHERRWWHTAFYRLWYGSADHIHVLSDYARERLVHDMGVPASKLTVIPHGNYESMRLRYGTTPGEDARRQWDVPNDKVLILFFGLIRPYKGVDRLISAVNQMRLSERCILLVAGGGSLEIVASVRSSVTTLEKLGRARMIVRFLAQQELADMLQASDIVVFPYTHIYQSGALLLAMTFGKAVVATDLPSFREYVQQGETGVLCNTEDSMALAGVLDRLVEDVGGRQRLGAAARESMLKDYDWSELAKRLVALYRVPVAVKR